MNRPSALARPAAEPWGMELGRSLFMGVCSMGMAALLTALEHMVSPVLWLKLTGLPGLSLEGIPPYARAQSRRSRGPLPGRALYLSRTSPLNWWWWPAILVFALSCGLIIGAIMQRYGAKGGWIIWGIWMAACFGPQLVGRKRLFHRRYEPDHGSFLGGADCSRCNLVLLVPASRGSPVMTPLFPCCSVQDRL